MAFFVRISAKSARDRLDGPLFGFDLSEEELRRRVVEPYRHGRPITLHGRTFRADNVAAVTITRIANSVDGVPLAQLRQAWRDDPKSAGEWIAAHAGDVTDEFIQEEPGAVAVSSKQETSEEIPQRGILGRLSGAAIKALAAIAAHPIIAASVGGVIAGLVLFWVGAGGGSDPQRNPSTPVDCAPAGILRGTGTYSQSYVPPENSTGQIGGGDILRISQIRKEDFVHSMTVRPGARLLVGLKLVNPGPGDVGNVNVKVSLPRTASQVLKLRGTISFDGFPNQVKSIATIYVKRTGACARYVPGTTVAVWRYPNEYRWRNPLSREDHIVSDRGLHLGGIPQMRAREARYIYFEIEVI